MFWGEWKTKYPISKGDSWNSNIHFCNMTCLVGETDRKLLAAFLTPQPAPSSAWVHHQWKSHHFQLRAYEWKGAYFQGFLTVKIQTWRSQGLKGLHLQEWLAWRIKQTGTCLSRKQSHRFERRRLAICLHPGLLSVANAFCFLSILCWLSEKILALPKPKDWFWCSKWKALLKKQKITTHNNPLLHLDPLMGL